MRCLSFRKKLFKRNFIPIKKRRKRRKGEKGRNNKTKIKRF